MRSLLLAAAVAVGGGVGFPTQGTPAATGQPGPDLSGSWTLESMSGTPGAGGKAGWGPRVSITQSGADLTVQPLSGSRIQFKTDGSEVAEVLSSEACRAQLRITKTVATSSAVTITTWLITQTNCFHGQTDVFRPDDPERDVATSSAVFLQTNLLNGKRSLESVTVVSRAADKLNIETTQSVPGRSPVSTSAIYRQ
jgi:hypothetical protein